MFFVSLFILSTARRPGMLQEEDALKNECLLLKEFKDCGLKKTFSKGRRRMPPPFETLLSLSV